MVPWSFLSFGFVSTFLISVSATQNWSSPAHYPGKPTGAYSTEWQSCPSLNNFFVALFIYFTDFEVTEPLENVTWSLPRNWAGSISTHTVGSPNNTGFLWGFKKSNGSLTDANSTKPWMIWLAGGPGYSSIASMLVENIGPIVVKKHTLGPNNNSWHKIADIVCSHSDASVLRLTHPLVLRGLTSGNWLLHGRQGRLSRRPRSSCC
jgi:carboxypeptidase D